MGNACQAPTCRTCGKSEFRHICSGLASARDRVREIEARPKPKAGDKKRKKGKTP